MGVFRVSGCPTHPDIRDEDGLASCSLWSLQSYKECKQKSRLNELQTNKLQALDSDLQLWLEFYYSKTCIFIIFLFSFLLNILIYPYPIRHMDTVVITVMKLTITWLFSPSCGFETQPLWPSYPPPPYFPQVLSNKSPSEKEHIWNSGKHHLMPASITLTRGGGCPGRTQWDAGD